VLACRSVWTCSTACICPSAKNLSILMSCTKRLTMCLWYPDFDDVPTLTSATNRETLFDSELDDIRCFHAEILT